MTDNITLPREVAKLALDHIEWYIENERGGRFAEVREAAEALRTALDAALAEPEKDAQCPTCGGGGLVPDPTWDWVRCDVCNPLPEKPEPTVKESLTVDHIRSIWLDSWKACGNVPTPVLAEHFARQIERAHGIGLAKPTGKDSLQVDAERYRWLRGELHGSRPPLARVVWKRHNIRESGDWTDLSDGQTLDEHIDAALAAPCLEVTVDPRLTPDEAAAISSALAAPDDIEALRRDAEQFRWMRENAISVDTVADPDGLVQVWVGTDPAKCFYGRTLDAAIVSAMAGSET
jgi:hypothetical protein